jgi:hypothetical protein
MAWQRSEQIQVPAREQPEAGRQAAGTPQRAFIFESPPRPRVSTSAAAVPSELKCDARVPPASHADMRGLGLDATEHRSCAVARRVSGLARVATRIRGSETAPQHGCKFLGGRSVRRLRPRARREHRKA